MTMTNHPNRLDDSCARRPTHALLSDLTPNRGTVVVVGSEDDCADAFDDDRQIVVALDPDSAVPEEGARVYVSADRRTCWE